jgi:hypothetical protein
MSFIIFYEQNKSSDLNEQNKSSDLNEQNKSSDLNEQNATNCFCKMKPEGNESNAHSQY